MASGKVSRGDRDKRIILYAWNGRGPCWWCGDRLRSYCRLVFFDGAFRSVHKKCVPFVFWDGWDWRVPITEEEVYESQWGAFEALHNKVVGSARQYWDDPREEWY